MTDQPKPPKRKPTKRSKKAGKTTGKDDLSKLIDERIAKALGVKPGGFEDAEDEAGLMSTPSVLSAVRATVYVRC